MLVRFKVLADNRVHLLAINGERLVEQCNCRSHPCSEEAVDVVLLDRERYVAR